MQIFHFIEWTQSTSSQNLSIVCAIYSASRYLNLLQFKVGSDFLTRLKNTVPGGLYYFVDFHFNVDSNCFWGNRTSQPNPEPRAPTVACRHVVIWKVHLQPGPPPFASPHGCGHLWSGGHSTGGPAL